MTVRHHPDDATLLRYASGDLDEAFAIIVATHLTLCPHCRQALHEAEEVGGHLLETGEEASLARDAFDSLMRRLDDSDTEASPPLPAAGNGSEKNGDVPLPLRRFVGSSLDKVPWKTVAPGVRKHVVELRSHGASTLLMLRIAPDKSVPEHGHGGAEMTLVLSGAYRDGLGRFGPGDVADLDEHVEHQPRVEPGEPCICLVAREAPTRYTGIFGRLLQPLVGI